MGQSQQVDSLCDVLKFVRPFWPVGPRYKAIRGQPINPNPLSMNAERLLVISSLVFLFAVCACSSDEGVRERATQAAQEQAAKGNPEVAPSAANTLPVAGTIMLQVQGGEVEKGQEVCLPLTARQFHQVVSMQYTLEWDPSVLAFKGIRNMRLPGLSKDNFGTHLTSQGKLTHAWYDLNVQGIDLPDGATLFELCFEAVGEPGAQTTFRFSDNPTLIEVSNAQSALLEVVQVPSIVKIRP